MGVFPFANLSIFITVSSHYRVIYYSLLVFHILKIIPTLQWLPHNFWVITFQFFYFTHMLILVINRSLLYENGIAKRWWKKNVYIYIQMIALKFKSNENSTQENIRIQCRWLFHSHLNSYQFSSSAIRETEREREREKHA